MADRISKEKRSANMAAIRSRDTVPEVYFRKLLFARGLRYRKNAASVTGHPDIYLAGYRTAIFINGCYWHRHPGCRFAAAPKSNVGFWNAKFDRNVERDRRVREELRSQGIKCLIVWECTVRRMMKDKSLESEITDGVLDFIRSGGAFAEY